MIAMTGATGFIGSYLSDKLKHPQKRLSRKKITRADSPHIWITGDLSNKNDLTDFIKNSPVLVHLACSTHPRTSNLDIKHDIHSNLLSTIQLFETYAKENPDGHIIYSSSGGNMYNASSKAASSSEEDLPCPQSSYGIHKLASENYLRLICEMYGIKGTVLRISNPYGVLLPKERAQGLIGVAFAKILANEPLQIFDSMESIRDYIHLEDVVAAFNLAIAKPPKKKECLLFNVSSGHGYSLQQVLQLIEEVSGNTFIKQYPLNYLPSPTYSVQSHNKIKNSLGWKPTLNLREGIQQMWHDSLQTQNLLKKL
jgi:UDP-glucose 4-epimerase